MGEGKLHFISEEEGGKGQNLILAVCFSGTVNTFLKLTSSCECPFRKRLQREQGKAVTLHPES